MIRCSEGVLIKDHIIRCCRQLVMKNLSARSSSPMKIIIGPATAAANPVIVCRAAVKDINEKEEYQDYASKGISKKSHN